MEGTAAVLGVAGRLLGKPCAAPAGRLAHSADLAVVDGADCVVPAETVAVAGGGFHSRQRKIFFIPAEGGRIVTRRETGDGYHELRSQNSSIAAA